MLHKGSSATASYTQSSSPGKVFLASRVMAVVVSCSHTVIPAWLFVSGLVLFSFFFFFPSD